jgi:phosphohistidine phosphatase SixA
MRTLLLIVSWLLLAPAHADEAAAWAALRHDPAIALMRHADAPGDAGDPPGFRLDDCATQRNLSERGQADARAIGERLRGQHAQIAKVLSSPWCRCIDTARLMSVGDWQIDAAFGNMLVLRDERDTLLREARAVIGRWKGPGAMLVVTHGANILALTGNNPAAGEIVVMKARDDGSLREVGRLAVPER